MDKINLKVYAKINYTLDITGNLPGGYHALDSVMSSVSAFDRMEISKFDGVECIMDTQRQDERNIAYRAVSMAMRECGIAGAKVVIHKGIPFEAGMGGSSADASGVLRALQELYCIDEITIQEMARRLGSDTNFMLNGGVARCKGKGDLVSPMQYSRVNLVAIKGEYSSSTAEIFKHYDSNFILTDGTESFCNSYPNIECYADVFNALQKCAVEICPNIEVAINDMKRFTKNVAMTGSGSAVYGIFAKEKDAKACVENLNSKYSYCKYLYSVPFGIEIEARSS